MAVSGSRNWAYTRNEIIAAALRQIGVGSQGATISAAKYTDGADTLNRMVLSWQNEGIFLWTKSSDTQMWTAATANYTLDADILEVNDVYWRHDGTDTPLTPLTRNEYMVLSDKDAAGTPTSYYVDYQLAAPVIYFYPVYAYTTSLVIGSDSNNYLCILDHTSATATNYPITGTSYSTYWESTSETGSAWADDTAYYSGYARYSKVLRLQDFDSSSDSPDFPVRWMNALVWGLAAEMAFEYQLDAQSIKFLNEKALQERLKAWAANGEDAPIQFSPCLRG